MTQASLKQIYGKLNELDQKVSALLVKEEKATEEEARAIRAGKRQFARGEYRSWKKIKAELH